MATPRAIQPKRNVLELAAEVFVKGFGLTRSFTHPFPGERVGPLWVLRDAPRKNPVDYRREEWIATDVDPAEVDQLARTGTRGRFCVCALVGVDEPAAPIRAAYKAMGYRLMAGEPVMLHPLKAIPKLKSPATIQRVLTQDVADALAKAAGTRQILPEHLIVDAPLRSYVAMIDSEIVGWVRSIVCDAGNWCSNMFVLPKHRRMGIASALLAKMLEDDREYGAKRAVLTSSHAGAKLYESVGYRQIGTLLLFTPRK